MLEQLGQPLRPLNEKRNNFKKCPNSTRAFFIICFSILSPPFSSFFVNSCAVEGVGSNPLSNYLIFDDVLRIYLDIVNQYFPIIYLLSFAY